MRCVYIYIIYIYNIYIIYIYVYVLFIYVLTGLMERSLENLPMPPHNLKSQVHFLTGLRSVPYVRLFGVAHVH